MRSSTILMKEQDGYFLHIAYCNKIYRLCNCKQFEYMDQIDFINLMNLRPTRKKVKVCPRQKGKVYYLLLTLSEHLEKQWLADKWISSVLDLCGLNRTSYDSHFTDVKNSDKYKDKAYRECVKEAIEHAKFLKSRMD